MVGQLAPGQVLGNPTASTALPKGTTIAGLGGVVGPASSTTGDVAVFNNATGTLLAVGTTSGTGNLVRANAPSLVSPALDTPTSLTLTNATGLPIAGVSGINASVVTWLASPTSANLGAAVTTTSTGTGSLVFANGPTLTTAVLASAVASGTWTATNWVVPAHTLGGTVSGGGNQINNVIIGSSTPLAGTFTVVTATTVNATTIGATTVNATTVNATAIVATTITPQNIVGTITNNSAATGSIGEYIQSAIATAVLMTTAVAQNIANIVLSPGDWDVSVAGILVGSASTALNYSQFGISQTSGVVGSQGGFTNYSVGYGLLPFNFNTALVSNIGPGRVSIATTATTYFVATVGFGTSTCGVYGTLRARRVR